MVTPAMNCFSMFSMRIAPLRFQPEGRFHVMAAVHTGIC